MGTAREWLWVAFNSIFWGGLLAVWEIRKRKAANLKPTVLPANVLIWTSSGLTFGLWMVFRWRALQIPLVFVTVGCVVFGSVVMMLTRNQRGSVLNQRQTWAETATVWLFLISLVLVLNLQSKLIPYLFFVGGGTIIWLVDYFRSRSRSLPARPR